MYISDLVNNLQYLNLTVESAKKLDSAILITHRKHIHTLNEFISLLHIAI